MLSSAGILGQIVAGSGAQVYRNYGRRDQPIVPGRKRPGWRKIPTLKKDGIKGKVAGDYENSRVYITRRCHVYADYIYGLWCDPEKFLWRDAIKRPGKSTYDLWMSEALVLLLMGHRPPDEPSISGGWSNRKAKEGMKWDPAPCFCLAGHRSFVIRVATGPPDDPGPVGWWHLKSTFQDPPPPPYPDSYVQLYFLYHPPTKTWQYTTFWPAETFELCIAPTANCLPYLLFSAFDDTAPDKPRRYKGAATPEKPWYGVCPEGQPWDPPPWFNFPPD